MSMCACVCVFVYGVLRLGAGASMRPEELVLSGVYYVGPGGVTLLRLLCPAA